MKLSTYAKKLGLKYLTVWGMYKKGLIPGAYQLKSGTIIVPDEPTAPQKPPYTVVYARVSSPDRKDQLKSQQERLCRFCEANGWKIDESVSEIASGLNDTRPRLERVFRERKATRIVVEHKDRLTRFGFNYIERLLSRLNCTIDVMYPNDTNEPDIIKDMIAIVTSFCCRLYGARSGQNKARKMKEALEAKEE